jgi:hypothetical protein
MWRFYPLILCAIPANDEVRPRNCRRGFTLRFLTKLQRYAAAVRVALGVSDGPATIAPFAKTVLHSVAGSCRDFEYGRSASFGLRTDACPYYER